MWELRQIPPKHPVPGAADGRSAVSCRKLLDELANSLYRSAKKAALVRAAFGDARIAAECPSAYDSVAAERGPTCFRAKAVTEPKASSSNEEGSGTALGGVLVSICM